MTEHGKREKATHKNASPYQKGATESSRTAGHAKARGEKKGKRIMREKSFFGIRRSKTLHELSGGQDQRVRTSGA